MSLQSKVSPWICVVISTSAFRGHRARRVEIFTTIKQGFSLDLCCHLDECSPRRDLHHFQERFLPLVETTNHVNCHSRKYAGTGVRRVPFISCYFDECFPRRNLCCGKGRFLPTVETTNSMLCHSRKYAGTGARRAPFEERSSPSPN